VDEISLEAAELGGGLNEPPSRWPGNQASLMYARVGGGQIAQVHQIKCDPRLGFEPRPDFAHAPIM
jgi:hypothetical protein